MWFSTTAKGNPSNPVSIKWKYNANTIVDNKPKEDNLVAVHFRTKDYDIKLKDNYYLDSLKDFINAIVVLFSAFSKAMLCSALIVKFLVIL